MPYIKCRKALTKSIEHDNFSYLSEGELNFVITKLCHNWIKDYGLGYSTLSKVIGVLECAKLELYRQIAAPYENKKKMENGSISNLDAKKLEDVR